MVKGIHAPGTFSGCAIHLAAEGRSCASMRPRHLCILHGNAKDAEENHQSKSKEEEIITAFARDGVNPEG